MQIKLRPLGHGGTRFTAIVVLSALVGFAVLAISLSKQGDAAFPGANGKIAYANGSVPTGRTSIWSANPDGSSPTPLTSGTATGARPTPQTARGSPSDTKTACR